MEVKSLPFLLFFSNLVAVNCFVVTRWFMCHGDCVNKRCERIPDNAPIECQGLGYGAFDTVCESECRATVPSPFNSVYFLCKGGYEGEECSSHHDYEIWNYNFFRIHPEGLLFPLEHQIFDNGADCITIKIAHGGNMFRTCSTHMDLPDRPLESKYRCPRNCVRGNCELATQITDQCAAFLPNYLFMGPTPKNFDGKLTATRYPKYKTIPLPDYRLPSFAPIEFRNLPENKFCRNGLMVVEGVTLNLEETYRATNSFHCHDEERPRWIILTAKVIVIDTSLIIYGCRKFILAGHRIEVKGSRIITLRGTDISEFNNPSEGVNWPPEWRPDAAKGKSSGQVIAITTQWTVHAKGSMHFQSKGGVGSCGSVSKFHGIQSESKRLLSVEQDKYIPIMFDRPFQEMAFEYIEIFRSPVCEGNVGVRFHVYSGLELIGNRGGHGESAKLFGINLELQRQVTSISLNGEVRPCDQTTVANSISPQFEIMYAGSCGFYVKEHSHLAWYFHFREKDDYFTNKYKNDPSDIRYHHSLFQSAFRIIDKWEAEEQLQFLEVLKEAYTWFNINWKEFYYLELRFIISNSRKIEDNIEFELLRGLRDVLLRSWEPSNVFQNWIFATAAAQEHRVKPETTFIIRMLKFVELKEELLAKLYTTEERNKRANQVAKEYNDFNDERIKVADEILNEDIKPTLMEVKQTLDRKFDQFKREAEVMIAQPEVERDALRENLKKTESTSINIAVVNAFLIFGSILTFFGPVAAEVGGVINAGADLGKTINEEVNKPKTPAGYRMPESVKRDMDAVVSWVDTEKKRLETKIQRIIKNVAEANTLADFSNFLTGSLDELRSIQPKHKQYGITKKVEENVKNEIQKLQNKLSNTEPVSEKGGDDDGNEGKEMQKKTAAILEGAANLMSSIDTTIKDAFQDNSNIVYISNEIDAVNEELKSLREFSEKIYNTIIPMTLDLMETFDYVTLQINANHLAAIDITKWGMESRLGEIKQELRKIVVGFGSGNDLDHTIGKMGKLLDIMSQIFSQIVKIKDTKISAAFQRILASRTVEPAYNEFVRYMDNEITNVMIRSEVTAVYSAFRQWSFPFLSVSMSNLPDFHLGTWNEDNQAVIQEALQIMKKVRSSIDSYQYAIDSTVGKFTQKGRFYVNPGRGLKAFYTWGHKDFGDKIYSIISGNQVFFTADIVELIMGGGHKDKQAIKFSAIGINLRVTKNKVLTNELNALLEPYKFIMVHMGYSYYSFDGKIYLFTGQEIQFVGSFDASTSNFAAVTVDGADAVLSPYGIWKFSLQPNDQHDFSELIEFLGQNPEIELDLIGDGTYVGDVRGERYRDPLVENYFKPIDEVMVSEPRNRDWHLQ